MNTPSILFPSTLKGYYFEQESLGVVPKIRLTVKGVEVEPLNNLTISQTMNNIGYFRYPGRRKLNFEASTIHELGDSVELILYHEGAGWDKIAYYSWRNPVSSNVYNLRITKKEYQPVTINSAEVYRYECDADFRGLGDKINITLGSNIGVDISPKINLITSYEGVDYTIQTAGEYKISEIFSDLAEYATFKQNKYNLLEIDGKVAKLIPSGDIVTDHVTSLTSLSNIKNVEDSKDIIQLAFWEGTEINKNNTNIGVNIIGEQDGKWISYTGTIEPVKNDKYFNLNMGTYLEVFNMFVPNNEIRDFLTWKIKQVDRKETFNMGTLFISTPLGGRVNVEVKPNTSAEGQPNNGIGWYGAIVGKKISYSLSDRFSFSYSIDVVKVGDWEPQYFNWGDDWDTGAIWRKNDN